MTTYKLARAFLCRITGSQVLEPGKEEYFRFTKTNVGHVFRAYRRLTAWFTAWCSL